MPAATDNPFLGLRSFDVDDESFFFGRERQVKELLRRLRRTRFVTVAGTSGSGKSSLIRAGLIPCLYREGMAEGGTHWRVVPFTPGNDPISSLSQAFNKSFYQKSSSIKAILTEPTLRRTSFGLMEAVRQAGLAEDEKLLIVVDQFEELFRFRQDPDNRRMHEQSLAFIQLLLEACADRTVSIYILLTLRSEFLGECARLHGLPEKINAGQYLIPCMTRSQYREAVTGPVGKAKAKITNALTNTLLNKVGSDPDQLPVLQHALARTWAEWKNYPDDEEIKLSHYRKVGGMEKALSNHANQIVDEILDEDGRGIVQRLFKCLTVKSVQGEGLRRPTDLRTVCKVIREEEDKVRKVVEVFLRPEHAFLVARPESLSSDSVLDISHESLIRIWDRLNKWVDEEAEQAKEYRRLVEAAKMHKQDSKFLWRGLELDFALKWREEAVPNQAWAQRYHADFEQAMSFLKASEEAREKREEEKKRAQAKEKERQKRELKVARERAAQAGKFRKLSIVLLLISLIAGGLAGYVFYQNIQTKQAKEAAFRAQSLLLTDLSRQETAPGDAVTGILLALEALSASGDQTDHPYVYQAEAALYDALSKQREIAISEDHKGKDSVVKAIFSPDGRFILTASTDGIARVWDINNSLRPHLLTLKEHDDALTDAVFSHDGQLILTTSMDGTILLWDAESGETNEEPYPHVGSVIQAGFSPDDSVFFTASKDHTVSLWRIHDSELEATLKHEDAVTTAVFSPDGQFLATASEEGEVRLWKVRGGRLKKTLNGHEDMVTQLRFSPPDGRFILTASEDGTVCLWKLDESECNKIRHSGDEGRLTDAAFSPDGSFVVAIREDGSSKLLWERPNDHLQEEKEEGSKGYQTDEVNMPFSPDKRLLLTLLKDNTMALWSWHIEQSERGGRFKARPVGLLKGHEDRITGYSFSPDGQFIVSASMDGTVRLWSTHSKQPRLLLTGHEEGITSAAFSPDGKFILTASDDGTARLWEDKKPIELSAHTDTVTHAAFSPDGKLLVTASRDYTARLWDSATGEFKKALKGHEYAVNHAAFSPDGRRVVTASEDNTARIWDTQADHSAVILKGHEGALISATFDSTGSRVLTGAWDNARLWNARDGAVLHVFAGHQEAVTFVMFSPDDRYVLTASRDATARLWNSETGREERVLKGHENMVTHAAFSSDGRIILTSSADGTARVWKLGDHIVETVLRGHEGIVIQAAFSPDDRLILSASSEDGIARLWETDSGSPKAVFNARDRCGAADSNDAMISDAAFSPDGKSVLISLDNGNACLWDIFPTTRELIEYARQAVPRRLTPAQRRQYHLIPPDKQ
ncbi:MAG: WD40 repeat domain-containing protein [Gammaproteobacteria bacterium]|nr:WD40 repeat domain-containing protein [Gammaproteobacteria bacterium]